MSIVKTKIMAFAASAAIVASLGLVACGGSSSSTSESSSSEAASSSVAADSTTTDSTTTDSTTTDSTTTDSTTTDSTTTTDLNSSSAHAWMGVSTAEETYYLAMANDYSEAILVVYDPAQNKYVSFVGPVTTPSDTQFTIADNTTGNTFTFELKEADTDGNMLLDAGEQGQVVLATCTVDEVVEAMANINNGAEAVA